ncbi:MAG: 2Fe-2S iron-sulfur cluster binding domain-containing protein [Proteobacteria bacterium]|nr:2Fe-2S iron-sulfur cluster binding domain-containing protein [Pseudomonadota bacterium]
MLKFHALRVIDVAPDAEDSVTVSLDVPGPLRGEYSGSAGQHVVVRASIDGKELRRTYSLLNAPGEWPLRIAPRVHPQGRMSRHLAQQVAAGDTLDVLPPNGSFTPRAPASAQGTYVAFASGCGITPVLSVIRALLAGGAGRVIVFYGNTSSARAMCLEELLGLKDRYLERLSLHFVMSREPQEAQLYNGRLDAQRVRQLADNFFAPPQVSEYFICGPGDMIEQVTGALRALGVDLARVHAEHFSLDSTESAAQPLTQTQTPAAASVPAAMPEAAGTTTVTVLMDGRRRSFSMSRDDETVLDAAQRAGIELPFSCRAGVCSTCRTKVTAGEVEMAQNYALEDWELEQGYVLACQSRAKTATLELDYDEK